MGSAAESRWVDWLNAESQLPRLRVPSGERDCGLGRVGRLANRQASVTPAPSPRPRLQVGSRLVRARPQLGAPLPGPRSGESHTESRS